MSADAMGNYSSLTSVFERGSANVIWCEHVLTVKNATNNDNTEWIAEFFNTWTNAAFCVVALLGLKRVASTNTSSSSPNRTAIVAAELVMFFGVGLGSFMFHAHQSRAAQVADELPMSLLMLSYNYCLRGLHPWTTDPQYSPLFYGASLAVVGSLWALYIYTGIYEVFLLCFTIQVLSSLALSYDAGRRAKHPPTLFLTSLFFLVFGKALWEWERYLYRSDACEAPEALWLHPLWHIGAALSHYYCMLNNSQLEHKLLLQNNNVSSTYGQQQHVKKE